MPLFGAISFVRASGLTSQSLQLLVLWELVAGMGLKRLLGLRLLACWKPCVRWPQVPLLQLVPQWALHLLLQLLLFSAASLPAPAQ